MTNKIKKISKLLFVSLGVLLLTVSTSAHARPADVIKDVYKVPITQGAISLVVGYGATGTGTGTDIDIQGAAATFQVQASGGASATPGIQIVPTGNQDVFDGDPSSDTVQPVLPAGGNGGCTDFVGARPASQKYTIPANFFTTTQMTNYGLQTAKNTASTTGTLKQKRGGCILLRLQIASTAQVGDKVNVIFDWDAGPSTSLEETQRSPIQVFPIEIIAGSASSAPVVSSSSAVISSSPSSSSKSSSVSSPSSSSSSSCASVSKSSSVSTSRSGSVSSTSSVRTTFNDIFGGIDTLADGPATTTTTTTGNCIVTPRSGGFDTITTAIIASICLAASACVVAISRRKMKVNLSK